MGGGGWHPWRTLLDEYPDWHIEFVSLPSGILGGVSVADRVIWVERSLGQIDRRWVAAHELVHMERGHDGPCNARIECSVSSEAARRLIPIEQLAKAAVWASSPDELANELWVPLLALVIRMNRLHPAERAYLQRRTEEKERPA